MRGVAFVVVVLLLSHPLAAADQAAAQKSIALAEQHRAASDHAAALRAYMEAVEADPAQASLERIRRYAPSQNVIFVKRDPAVVEQYERRWKEAKEPHIAALRQYLRLHPNVRDAVVDLVFLLPDAEGEELLDATLQVRPDDPVLYSIRGMVRGRTGRIEETLADYEKSASLDPTNADRFFDIANVATGFVAKRQDLSDAEKQALLTRARAAIARAELMRPGDSWGPYYRGVVEREQSKLDPAGPPYRVGGDVKPPVVVSRVAPVYPEEAKKKRVSGIVIFEVVVDKDGRITKTKVLKPLPAGLTEAAEQAVKQWTLRPGTLNGEPVEVVHMLTVNMKLPAE